MKVRQNVSSCWRFVNPKSGHASQLVLCVKRTVTVRISVGAPPASAPELAPPELAVLGTYARSTSLSTWPSDTEGTVAFTAVDMLYKTNDQ